MHHAISFHPKSAITALVFFFLFFTKFQNVLPLRVPFCLDHNSVTKGAGDQTWMTGGANPENLTITENERPRKTVEKLKKHKELRHL